MEETKVIIVVLRQPEKYRVDEMRSDPFWEFGSFGCTGCHGHNLLNPNKVHEREGARLAFAQGGHLGFRLVYLTPPIGFVKHKTLCEAKWAPPEMPLGYTTAPLLINNDGKTAFPLLRDYIEGVNRTTWVSKFASKFRSRTRPLEDALASELLSAYDLVVESGGSDAIATSYVDALPYLPPKVDQDRMRTYKTKVSKASSSC